MTHRAAQAGQRLIDQACAIVADNIVRGVAWDHQLAERVHAFAETATVSFKMDDLVAGQPDVPRREVVTGILEFFVTDDAAVPTAPSPPLQRWSDESVQGTALRELCVAVVTGSTPRPSERVAQVAAMASVGTALAQYQEQGDYVTQLNDDLAAFAADLSVGRSPSVRRFLAPSLPLPRSLTTSHGSRRHYSESLLNMRVRSLLQFPKPTKNLQEARKDYVNRAVRQRLGPRMTEAWTAVLDVGARMSTKIHVADVLLPSLSLILFCVGLRGCIHRVS
jgi:hypothetical protein